MTQPNIHTPSSTDTPEGLTAADLLSQVSAGTDVADDSVDQRNGDAGNESDQTANPSKTPQAGEPQKAKAARRVLFSEHILTFPERQRLLILKNFESGLTSGELHAIPTGSQVSIKLVDDANRNAERKIDEHLIRLDDTAEAWFKHQSTENIYHMIRTTGRLPVAVEDLDKLGIDLERAESEYTEFKRASVTQNAARSSQNAARSKDRKTEKTRGSTARGSAAKPAQDSTKG